MVVRSKMVVIKLCLVTTVCCYNYCVLQMKIDNLFLFLISGITSPISQSKAKSNWKTQFFTGISYADSYFCKVQMHGKLLSLGSGLLRPEAIPILKLES